MCTRPRRVAVVWALAVAVYTCVWGGGSDSSHNMWYETARARVPCCVMCVRGAVVTGSVVGAVRSVFRRVFCLLGSSLITISFTLYLPLSLDVAMWKSRIAGGHCYVSISIIG